MLSDFRYVKAGVLRFGMGENGALSAERAMLEGCLMKK